MSHKECFIDESGEMEMCIWEAEDCVNCPDNHQENICGFSMSAPVVRQCIKGRCRFWVDVSDKETRELSLSIAFADTLKEPIEGAKGYCVFEVV